MAGTTSSVTHTFASGTKAKSAEVNTNFADLVANLNGGTINPVFNKVTANEGFFGTKTSPDSLTITAGSSMMGVDYTIDTGHTYVVPTNASLGIIGRLTVNERLDVLGGSVWVV